MRSIGAHSAFAERPYGWRVNFGLFVPTKIKPCIATFAMLATLREGRPLPYVPIMSAAVIYVSRSNFCS